MDEHTEQIAAGGGYTDAPTHVRVFSEDGPGGVPIQWCIDGFREDDATFTEAIWDCYDGETMTREAATAHAPEFAAAHGWAELPIIVFVGMGEPWQNVDGTLYTDAEQIAAS